MYILKGFINIDALANNTPGSVATLGELSNASMSYAIEKGYYNRENLENVELVSFTSRYDTATTKGPKIAVPAKYSDHVLTVMQWIFNQSIADKISNDAEAFRTLLLAQYGTIIDDCEIGKMVVEKGNWLPSYIAWKFDTAGEDNAIRIWLSDDAFKTQYDEYQIVVIPPIEPVDIFQRVKSIVAPKLAEFTVPGLHVRVLEKTKGEPYTYLISKDYPWYDREDPTATLMTTWTVAIYGIAGNNLEVIKDALADYILANSTYDRDDWIPVFPDIFTNTEFTFIPFWQRRSVVDETVRGSLYSPIVPYDGLPAFAAKFTKYVPVEHLQKYLMLAGIQYKSIASVVIGGNENRNKKYLLTDYFPDYALISTTSIDFNRMSASTVEFITKLTTAVIAAEEMDEYSYIGATMSRITRDGILYVGFSHEDVSFLVVSRGSLEKILAASQMQG